MHNENLLNSYNIYSEQTSHKCHSPANTSSKLLFDDRLLGIFFWFQRTFSRNCFSHVRKVSDPTFCLQVTHLGDKHHSFLCRRHCSPSQLWRTVTILNTATSLSRNQYQYGQQAAVSLPTGEDSSPGSPLVSTLVQSDTIHQLPIASLSAKPASNRNTPPKRTTTPLSCLLIF